MSRLVLKIKSIKVEGKPLCNYKWRERHPTLPRLCASFVCPNMSMKQPIAEEYVVLQQPARAARRLFSTLFFFQPLLFPTQPKGPAPLKNAVLPSLLTATSPQTGQLVKYVLWTESPKSTRGLWWGPVVYLQTYATQTWPHTIKRQELSLVVAIITQI